MPSYTEPYEEGRRFLDQEKTQSHRMASAALAVRICALCFSPCIALSQQPHDCARRLYLSIRTRYTNSTDEALCIAGPVKRVE